MSEWWDDEFFSGPISGAEAAQRVGADPNDVVYNIVSVCYGQNNIERTRQRISSKKTGKESFVEVQKIGEKVVFQRRDIDHGQVTKTIQKMKNISKSDLPSFKEEWNKLKMSLTEPEYLNPDFANFSSEQESPKMQTSPPPESPTQSLNEDLFESTPISTQISKPRENIRSERPLKKKAGCRKVNTAILEKRTPLDIDPENLGDHNDELRMLDLVNAERALYGLPPLEWDQNLRDITVRHSIRMMQKIVPLSHEGCQERFKLAEPAERKGENVAYNLNEKDPVAKLNEQWIHSVHHHSNMLGPFNAFGVSFAKHNGEWYGTQLYVRRLTPGKYNISKLNQSNISEVLSVLNEARKSLPPLKLNTSINDIIEPHVKEIIQRFKMLNMDGFQERAKEVEKRGYKKYSESTSQIDAYIPQENPDVKNHKLKDNSAEILKNVANSIRDATLKKIQSNNYSEVAICVYHDEFENFVYTLGFLME